ncbi:hypothetical protein FNV43_RR09284 [Rhamnella rubrinervis]|uniref:RING-type E3 ubiquitin transferase n=1 Tax=Rhamnella rubrinervis TaxID=2594499 RepID=A0A8K0HA67_9ROSA|nr:hypothetical protein FNV43_RR09284 [Rhamnella rubrinervis]
MSGGVGWSSYSHVRIRTLNSQGVETISWLYLQPDADGEDNGDGEALRVSAASERSARELKKVRIESPQSPVQLCAVCLEELSVGTEATCMPCSHLYHEDCILKWLQKSTLCPLCRFVLC